MLTEKAIGVVSETKMGKHKKMLMDVHRWQSSYRKTPPLHGFLKWLLGN
jgi:hypothetical protein